MALKTTIWISLFALFLIDKELENPCGIMFPMGGDEDWGTGTLYFPDTCLMKIYNSENENVFGYIIKKGSQLKITNNIGQIVKLNWRDTYVNIRHPNLSFLKTKFNKKKSRFEILWKGLTENLYVDVEETKNANIQYFSYKTLLFASELNSKIDKYRESLSKGVNLEKSCLNLRSKPNAKSKIIYCIPGNDWTDEMINHVEILESNGNWAKVELITWIFDTSVEGGGEGCNYREKERRIGWVKAIDDSGFPNIWYSVSAY